MKTENLVGSTPSVGEDSVRCVEVRNKRLIFAATIGNALELFDFTVYSFFAVVIGKVFFPADGEYGPLLLSFATFGVGFLTRPLGGIVLGAYADRAGRKAAMTLTILLMATGTAIIGLTPSYAQIGVAAPLLVVFGRLIQGFSAGGEVGATMAFLMESATAGRRGYFISWQMTGQGAAPLIGALVGVVLTWSLPQGALEAWGWRVPFLLGLLIGPVGFYIRRHLDETHHWTPTMPGAESKQRFDWCRIALGTLIMTGGTSTMYTMVYYLPSYLTKVGHLPPTTALTSGCVAGVALMLLSPIGGRLADRLDRRKPIAVATSAISLLVVVPLFALVVRYPGLSTIVPIVGILIGLMALASASGSLLLIEGFPASVRVRSLAFIYGLGVSLFGGFSPLIVTWAVKVSGNPYAPGIYVATCSLLSFIALLAFVEKKTD